MKKFEQLGKVLSKEEQKKITGRLGDPGSGGYMCCWDSDPTNCSACVPGAQPSCVAKASPVRC